MRYVPLHSICRPKQWKTIASSKLRDEGYPVYGANGIIGYHDEFNHEHPTLLITCRGATCGKLNVSKPFSYINGNAMALDDLSGEVDLNFLAYFLAHRGFDDVISGSAQPQITGQGLQKVLVPLPSLEKQKRIAGILDEADRVRKKTQALIDKYDELAQSLFLDMFGDPVTNPKGWEVKPLGKVCLSFNGFAFKSHDFEKHGVPVVRMSNFDSGPVDIDSAVCVSREIADSKEKFSVERGDFLIALSGATTGKFGLFQHSKRAMLNQRIAALRLESNHTEIMKFGFFIELMKHVSKGIYDMAMGAAQPNVSLNDIREIEVFLPPVGSQEAFVKRHDEINRFKGALLEAAMGSEELFNALLQKAFKGELT